jgi:hypothetical protein
MFLSSVDGRDRCAGHPSAREHPGNSTSFESVVLNRGAVTRNGHGSKKKKRDGCRPPRNMFDASDVIDETKFFLGSL